MTFKPTRFNFCSGAGREMQKIALSHLPMTCDLRPMVVFCGRRRNLLCSESRVFFQGRGEGTNVTCLKDLVHLYIQRPSGYLCEGGIMVE